MTEQQPYTVISRNRAFELRRYPAHVVAEVEMGGTFERAGNAAFRPLVSYISGRNRGGKKVAMTAPVIQQPARAPDTYLVSFVMPAGSTVDSLPVPAEGAVTIHDVPEQTAAVSRFSGRWSRTSYEDHLSVLRSAVRDANLETAGEPRYARFDPPWKPWFARRNEVILPVRDRGSAA